MITNTVVVWGLGEEFPIKTVLFIRNVEIRISSVFFHHSNSKMQNT